MTEPLQLPPPLEGDISFRTLERLVEQPDSIDPSVLMVFFVGIVDSPVLPWLGEQFLLSDNGWELAESDDVRRMLMKTATELHRYKGAPWSIRGVIRHFGSGEVDLIEDAGCFSYDGDHSYNGLFIHGDVATWAVYHVILRQSIISNQIATLCQTLAALAPARYHLASLEYQSVVTRYNNTAIHDGSCNHGSS